MATPHLVIAPAAQSDLRDIYQYGLQQWGKTQSERYLETLKEHFWVLTEQPLMGIVRNELLPEVRSLPIESHILFYRFISNQIEVIRVLHQRQDPARHLR